MKHATINVSGKVQGVFFRKSALEKARELGITGFAQNKSDGTVHIEAEGDEKKLHQLISWCKEGPLHANVSTVDYSFSSKLKNFSDFQILS